MSVLAANSIPENASNSEPYPYHRDCAKCGYDIFGLPRRGACPECGESIDRTSRFPLWSVSAPRALRRSRLGLRLISNSLATLLAVAITGIVCDALSVAEAVEPFALVLSLVAVLAFTVGTVLLGTGVGSMSTWRRWLPTAFTIALIGGAFIGEEDGGDGPMWLGMSIGFTLFWLLGVSLQAVVADVSSGVAARAARIRSARMMKVTRLLLFSGAALVWTVTLVAEIQSELVWAYFGLALIALWIVMALLALWLILAAIHWIRLLKLWNR